MQEIATGIPGTHLIDIKPVSIESIPVVMKFEVVQFGNTLNWIIFSVMDSIHAWKLSRETPIQCALNHYLLLAVMVSQLTMLTLNHLTPVTLAPVTLNHLTL